MEYFLPSDVARLVLGYLKENGYINTYSSFLKECNHLQEYYQLLRAGRELPTTILGLSLLLILEEWGRLKQEDSFTHSPAKKDARSIHQQKKPNNKNSDKNRKQNFGLALLPVSPQKSNEYTTLRNLLAPGADSQKPQESRNTVTLSNYLNSPSKHANTDLPDIKRNRILKRNPSCSVIPLSRTQDSSEPQGHDKGVSERHDCSIQNGDSSESEGKKYLTDFDTVEDGCADSVVNSDSNKKCLSWINDNLQEKGSSENTQNELKSRRSQNDGDKSAERCRKHSPCKGKASPDKSARQVTPSKSVVSNNGTGPHVTPIKLFQSGEAGSTRSPRRKKPKTPRKRSSDVSPVSHTTTTSNHEDPRPIFQQILCDTRLHEKLAETCNLVTVQLKLNHSGKDGEKETEEKSTHDPPAEELEAITASKSLEEILDMDTNFATDLLGDKVDMNDPAFESLFKLFGTDKETFHENQKKEKKRTDQMAAEVEELEKSIQEMARTAYVNSPQNQDFVSSLYESPTHVPFSSQPLSSAVTDSCPSSPVVSLYSACQEGAASFTPSARRDEVCSSPLHSTPYQNSHPPSLKSVDQCVHSPCSTTTQPFSPTASEYNRVSHPATPMSQVFSPQAIQHQSPPQNSSFHCESPYGNQEVPSTPKHSQQHQASMISVNTQDTTQPCQSQDLFMSPTTSSTLRNGIVAQSTPVQPKQTYTASLPANCSPLVKSDLHAGSPLMTQKNGPNTPQARKCIFTPSSSNRRVFSPQPLPPTTESEEPTLVNVSTSEGSPLNDDNFHPSESGLTGHQQAANYLKLVNDVLAQESEVAAESVTVHTDIGQIGEVNPCPTIENTIGCISLPPAQGSPGSQGEDKAEGKTKKPRGKKGGRRAKSKLLALNTNPEFTTLKGILSQPPLGQNSPDSQAKVDLTAAPQTPEPGLLTDSEIKNQNIVILSPGGTTSLSFPVLRCQDEAEQQQDQTLSLWGENLESATQFSILPENQVTQPLLESITSGNPAQALSQIQDVKNSDKTRSSKNSRKTRAKKYSKKKKVSDEDGYFQSPNEADQEVADTFQLDPNEIYTATPVLSKVHVRNLNFGPNAEEAPQFRKIVPRPPPPVESPQTVIIVNGNGALLAQPDRCQGLVIPPMCNPCQFSPPLSNNGCVPILPKFPRQSDSDKVEVESENVHTVKVNESVDDVVSEHLDNKRETFAEKNYGMDDTNFSPRKLRSKSKKRTKSEGENPGNSYKKNVKTFARNVDSKSMKIETLDSDTPIVNKNKIKMLNSVPYRGLRSQLKRSFLTVRKTDQQSEQTDDDPTEYGSTETIEEQDEPENVIMIDESSDVESSANRKSNAVKLSLPKNVRKPSKNENKLKVKITRKKSESEKIEKVKLTLNRPFKFVSLSDSSDEDDVPLSKLKDKLHEPDKSLNSTKDDIIDVPTTPVKAQRDSDEEELTPTKEKLLEKVGLTPKKSLNTPARFQSPERANPLDLLAEWQSSPVSARKLLTPSRRGRNGQFTSPFKSPATPRRRTPAKKLFNTPTKVETKVKTVSEAIEKRNGIVNSPVKLNFALETNSNVSNSVQKRLSDMKDKTAEKSALKFGVSDVEKVTKKNCVYMDLKTSSNDEPCDIDVTGSTGDTGSTQGGVTVTPGGSNHRENSQEGSQSSHRRHHHHHHHKHKHKKKGKKRHRDESLDKEARREHKRRKKEKKARKSMENLCSLNIDAALSQVLYSKDSSPQSASSREPLSVRDITGE